MKKIIVPIILGLSAATAVLLGMWFYYNKSIREIEEQSMASSTVYDKHYAMISGEDDSLLWRSIYNSAREYASGENAYLEWVGADSVTDYLAEDCIRIGIASKVDGIILQPDGSSTMTDLINSAAEQGIPVVTVLNDDSESSRVSFVGLNSYQMGEIYGQQILKLLGEGETSIQVLTHSSTEDINTNLMYSKMNSVVEQGKKKGQTVNISTYSIDNSMSFDAEEVIRDIFVNSETLPDILICLDSVSTECACQAIIDYNEVGNVDIIGYYTSSSILDAIEKDLMPVTIVIDTEQIGQLSINALNEYHSLGYVSNYFNAELNIITKSNVNAFARGQETEVQN